jgi:hypothetical protein
MWLKFEQDYSLSEIKITYLVNPPHDHLRFQNTKTWQVSQSTREKK